ncbi:MAG: YbjQ family protein [Lachnospiraceae bacterium]|nr:YbjQ family protein [Lachnospiraceae bacterium]
MIKTTTETIPGKQISEVIGVVFGNDLYSVEGLMSGGLASHEKLYKDALNNAFENLEKEALAAGADAVIGVHSNITAPAGLSHVVVNVTGTAVKLIYSAEEQEQMAQSAAAQAKQDLEAAARRREEEEQARSQRVLADAQAKAATAGGADGGNVSALETSLINLLLKHPDGMDGVGISKKIPRIYYSPAEVSSALKHLVEISLLDKDEFGVFTVNQQQA